jgi:hypothetical protein
MKKLILFLALIASVALVNAQDFSASKYFMYTGTASDTVNGSSDAEYITWIVNRPDLYFYQVEAEIDEISGSATAYVILQASNDNSHWNEIDTLGLFTTGVEAMTADGTVYIGDLSTGVAWRYMRTKLVISTTGKWDYNYVIFRAVGKND